MTDDELLAVALYKYACRKCKYLGLASVPMDIKCAGGIGCPVRELWWNLELPRPGYEDEDEE